MNRQPASPQPPGSRPGLSGVVRTARAFPASRQAQAFTKLSRQAQAGGMNRQPASPQPPGSRPGLIGVLQTLQAVGLGGAVAV